MILLGNEVAKSIDEKSKALAALNKPTLAIVRVGDNSSDVSYERGLIKRCEKVGVHVKNVIFPIDIEIDTFYETIHNLNKDSSIHGILMFRPLPKYLDNERARKSIAPEKDVDGCTDLSLAGVFTNTNIGYAPCTAQAVMECLEFYKIDVTSKNVVIVGRSLVVGKPLSMMMCAKNATVTLCHTKTKKLKDITQKADIVVVATGQMESMDESYFSSGQTVIDVGINYNEKKQKLCGDILYENVEPIVENITPVPRGIGSITNSVLVYHVCQAANKV
ncbi:bifunctional 5,10-methylenetetrahydrofolate dehydrogenase/5,10-methenyltetrahydrofolate cyclohydrolase [Floccifex sp.]|uniref:bifunctional 5,10-methylenetetrahydrofolate dehydrogenase/5,10-methenyltetrahydrofolate cyclohydrolase n=1 Tax=Floccifex sp. TaxID=2815810 RepID=UPI003F064E38